MILGHVQCWQGQKALELFERMQQGVQPYSVTFVGVMNACASILVLEEGRCVHQQIVEFGWDSDMSLWGLAWLTLLKACANVAVIEEGREGQKAHELFQQMQQEGMQPNSVTFVGALNAYASVFALEEGMCVHQQIIQHGLESNVFVESSSVDMYAKCGSLEDAWSVFNKMLARNVVTWTSMILGHVQCGQGQMALGLFQEMKQEGVDPNSVTFVGMLNACASVFALEEGRCVHQEVIQSGLELDVFVRSSLVDIHAGLVDEGMGFYASMVTDYIISPKLKHYTWIVDLLGCAGHLQEAENMVIEMPWKPHVAPWMGLLGACRIHGNVEMAERIAKWILEMELENLAGYVVLSNIYAAAGNRHLCENVERQRMARGVKRQPGRTLGCCL
ncbi:unnamed protein product [Sphagnum jensenii]|uniref:Pentatricopeptide repeat-containing protein n=1 Tax=Sphagnum jensenii TaxID=128206 RepID=A0ABP1B5C9_9BRYO